MKRFPSLTVLLVLAAVAPLAPAGVFSVSKKVTKVDPAQRVQQLLATIKTDGDESKRSAAAKELREFDAGQFPQMIPVLCDVLLTDAKVSVRAEAAQTLGKLRPVNQQAGNSLEQAVAKDASLRVRLSARTALLGYYMAGFKGGKKDDTQWPTTKEPPLAEPTVKTPAPAPAPAPSRPNPVQPTRVIPNETPPPPLADPEPPPANRSTSPLVPTNTPALQPA